MWRVGDGELCFKHVKSEASMQILIHSFTHSTHSFKSPRMCPLLETPSILPGVIKINKPESLLSSWVVEDEDI